MMKRKKLAKITGGLFFMVGIILGLALCATMVWGDLEASLFTTGIRADASLKSLNCPVLITPSETSQISATLKNPTQKQMERYLVASVSEGYSILVREVKTKLPLPPSGKNKVEWDIYPEDAAFNDRVILFRVYVNPKYPYPSLGANCGVIRVDLPGLTGNQILLGSAGLFVSSLVIGAVLIETGIRPVQSKGRSKTNAVYALAGILIAGVFFSYLGHWILGVLALAISALMIVILALRAISGK